MTPIIDHPWNLSQEEAVTLQTKLARQVTRHDAFDREVHIIAGVDVAYSTISNHIYAAAVLIDATSLRPIESETAVAQTNFPYIPGLFSFREIPALIEVLSRLQFEPDLIICDGQGIAHPRRFGMASHLGFLFDVPTIGCAKTRFVGEHSHMPTRRGEHVDLMDHGEVVGSALCTHDNVKPLYLSIGHKISLETARQWILRLTPHFRQPESTRLANTAVNALRSAKEGCAVQPDE